MSKPKGNPAHSNPHVTAAVQTMLRNAHLPSNSRVVITPPPKPIGASGAARPKPKGR